jgi:prepilin-type N-terminal cleavage/methylation domain-containing protein
MSERNNEVNKLRLRNYRFMKGPLPSALNHRDNADRGVCSTLHTPHSTLQNGFTLIEIIVVIVILSIVSAITIKFMVDSIKIYTMTVNQKTLFDEGKLALERMCRDIRDARSITGTTASSITFIRNDATAQDIAGETIIFQRNAAANTLEKVKSSPVATSTMASNVTAFRQKFIPKTF